MKQLTQEELKPMLDEHRLWVYSSGDEGKRLVLEDTMLDHVSYNNCCLREAIFRNVQMLNVYTKESNFIGAVFDHVHIDQSVIAYCDFEYANVSDSEFSHSYFERCIILEATLENVSFTEIKFTYNHMRKTTLKNVDFSFCSLHYLDFGYCNLEDVKGLPGMACPEKGSFIGWKKVLDYNTGATYIVKLEIPEDAKRSSGIGNKCRCDKAKVLEIYNLYNPEDRPNSVLNNRFDNTIYTLDDMVYPDEFDDNRWNECSHGIHFFMDKEKAIEYEY